jgi:hypothetical protein
MNQRLQNVLLVSADVGEASRLSRALTEFRGASGVEVLCVETLSAAVAAVTETPFDAVLLDLSLPDSQGVDTARRLLAMPCPAVVALVGPDDESAGMEAVRLGAQDFLVAAQTDDEALSRALSHAVGRHGLVLQLAQARAQLECRVDERTRELRYAVDVLQEEVAARRQTEERLRHANELLEHMFSNTYVMLACLDRHYNYVRVNSRFAQYNNRKESFYTGKNYFDVNPIDGAREVFDHIVRTGEPLTGFEKTWIDPNDPQESPTYWNWSMMPVKDADGNVEGLVLSHQDVTESVRDREALQESERKEQEARLRLAAIVESSENAIFSVTTDGTVTTWNRGAQRLWGYEAGDIVGRSVGTLFPSRRSDVPEWLRQVFAGRPLGLDTAGVSKSRRAIHVSMSLSVLRDSDGRVFGASFIARDITARKRMEMEILQVIDEERQRARFELHERLAQRLSGSAMLCRALGRTLTEAAAGGNGYARFLPLAQSAEQIEDELRAAVGQTTALAHGLMPVAPTPEALMDSLKELARQTEIERKITCEFRCERSVRVPDAAMANQLYRVAQEAISNAVRHAQATSVVLELGLVDGTILMTIADNGLSSADEGSKTRPLAFGGLSKPRRHGPAPTGVQVMAYRADSIGGSLTVRQGDRGGTVVQITVPPKAVSSPQSPVLRRDVATRKSPRRGKH